MELGVIITIVGSIIAVIILIIQLFVEKRKGTFDSNKMSIKLGKRDEKNLKDSTWAIAIGVKKPETEKTIIELPIVIENTSNIVRKDVLVNLILPTKYVVDFNDDEFFKILEVLEKRPENDLVKRWISNVQNSMAEISYRIDYISPKSPITIVEPITFESKEIIDSSNFDNNSIEKINGFKAHLKLFNKKSKPIYKETNILVFLSKSKEETLKFSSNYFSYLLSTVIKNRYYNLKPGIYYIPFFIKWYEKIKFRKYKFHILHITPKIFKLKNYLFSMSESHKVDAATDDMTYLLRHSSPKLSEIFNFKRILNK